MGRQIIISEEETNRIKKLYSILTEKETAKIKRSQLTVEDGKLKLWHYSNKDFDSTIRIDLPPNLHSVNEFKAWGKGRSFFYATEHGYESDVAFNKDYLYICHIDMDKVYDINKNPNNYPEEEGYNFFESLLNHSINDGYTAWIYNLDKNDRSPIVVSFVDVPITEKLKWSNRGEYLPTDQETEDEKVGTIMIDDEEWDVYQPADELVDITNLYAKQEDSDYKRPIDFPKNINFTAEQRRKYLKTLGK